jgi:hypothetical protein
MDVTTQRCGGRVFFVYVAALCLFLGAIRHAQAAPVLFGSTVQGPSSTSSLYRVDSSTGAATLIGSIGFGRVGAIDFDSSGTLYGVGVPLGQTNLVLLKIDLTTGAGTPVGNLGAFPRLGVADLSFRNADAVIFAYQGGHILSIDKTTGLATEVGYTGSFPDGNGLAFSTNDILYHVDGQHLHIVDQTTVALTIVTNMDYGSLDPSGEPRANAMDFDNATGVLWASIVDGFNGSPVDSTNYLATINITDGSVTVIGQTVSGLEGIAVQPQTAFIAPFNITAIAREGDDIRVTWTCGAAMTNVLQVTSGAADGSYTDNFADLSPQIILAGSPSTVTTNFLDGGGATNQPARYYRVRLVP